MTTRKRGPGRPRSSPASPGTSPRDQILDAAAELFTTHGYAATGTRQIAAAAGLRPASLFYWFARKDDILVELLDRTVAPALVVSDAVRNDACTPDLGLFALARSDVRNLCSGVQNLAALQLLPEARGATFAPFWARREELRARYRELVEAIDAADRLMLPTVELATDVVFGAVESVITWFDRRGPVTPAAASEAVALAMVRGVVSRPASLRSLSVYANLVDSSVTSAARASVERSDS